MDSAISSRRMFRTLFREVRRQTQRAVGFGSLAKSFPSTTPSWQWRSVASWLDIYKKLSKAKLSSFVVFSSATGFILASKEEIEWRKLGATVVGTFGASASANAWNQIYEREKDALMSRTRLRPLPLGRISVHHAIAFALISGISGVALLMHQTNEMAAGLAAGNILLYACVYTPLKQITIWNTWIGAVVGAIPPVIGWTAAKETVDPGTAVLFSALYFWQIPHFLSLAWTYKADYANAGYCMMSRFDATGRRLATCAFRNCIYLLPLSFLTCSLGVTDSWFSYESTLLTLWLALSASAFSQKPSKQNSRSLFRVSILYLPIFLFTMLFHRQASTHHTTWIQLQEQAQQILQFRPKKSKLDTPTSSKHPLLFYGKDWMMSSTKSADSIRPFFDDG